ncbi:MAG: adenosyl-hopene transferase HpnH [Alphaproteobacteria bacterium]|nr:adenosyl-hopene transferase HpnH [Alphaproteobacteria bacterium]
MGIPVKQAARIGAYVLKQHLLGRSHYPLVLMLEPLFRCNLACSGCGKIDYPDPILNQRLSYDQCMEAIDECGAPAVSIAGGEPLLHKDMPEIVKGYLKRKKFVILCTNALLLAKKIDQYTPHENFTWSIHLDGDREMHDQSVNLEGTYDSMSPGYAYERAPDQEHFLNRERTKKLFRDILSRGNGGKNWAFTQSELFLDFLAGNQTYHCTPWSMPLRTVFGWQKPCYLLGEGYAKTFRELMEGTEWEKYGVGNYEKCANCMVHCGFEGTAVADSVKHPWKIVPIALRGVKTTGPMAPDIPLDKQRPAEYVFSRHVETKLAEIREGKTPPKKTMAAE